MRNVDQLLRTACKVTSSINLCLMIEIPNVIITKQVKHILSMFIQSIHWVINVDRIIDFETCSNEQCSYLLEP